MTKKAKDEANFQYDGQIQDVTEPDSHDSWHSSLDR